jgi:cell division protein FtsZ
MGLEGPEYFTCNSDKQALDGSICENKLQIGKETTRGLGCGSDPAVGEEAMKENMEEVLEALKDSDIIFIATGLGGGTGTGGAPILAETLGKGRNKPLVVSVVIMPLSVENRTNKAMPALQRLYKASNSVITIFNDKLFEKMPKKTFPQIRAAGDEVLYKAVSSITDIIKVQGAINIDFADIQTVLRQPGPACIGYGMADGEDRATKAFEEAVNSPIMDIDGIRGAKAVLVNLTSKEDDILGEEFILVCQSVNSMVSPGAIFITGYGTDKSLEEGFLRVTIIASGLCLPENSLKSEKSSKELDGGGEPRTLAARPPAPAALTEAVDSEAEARPGPEILAEPSIVKKEVPLVVKLSPAAESRSISPTKPFNSLELSQQMRLGNKYETNSRVDPVKYKAGGDKEPAFMRQKAD